MKLKISKEDLIRIDRSDAPTQSQSQLQPWGLIKQRLWQGGLLFLVLGTVLGTFAAGLFFYFLHAKRSWIQRIALKARYSVLQVETQRGTGTAFVIASHRGKHLVLTNRHVIVGKTRARPIRFRTYFGEQGQATLVALPRDPRIDLALLLVRHADLKPLGPVTRFQYVQDGTQVVTVGHPLGALDFSVSTGIVASKRDHLIQLDMLVNPGNSGGPVVDRQNRICGVVTSAIRGEKVEGIAFATRADWVLYHEKWRFISHREETNDLLKRIDKK